MFRLWGVSFLGVLDARVERLEVDGKFFRAGGRRVFLKMVSYGPFPEPRPEGLANDREELARVAAAGFNAVRVYGEPELGMLDAARDAGLWVLVGLKWPCRCDFLTEKSAFSEAKVKLAEELGRWGDHPAVAGVLVANEIPGDLVRWMGVRDVRAAVEELILLGKKSCPKLLYGYANYPTTEYLEPDHADFTAMNVYLEQREAFAGYLPRLHNVAGDRPVLVSEFGLDTQRNSEQLQRDSMLWCLQESLQAGMAGVTYFTWSDWWWNETRVMDEWSFGIVDKEGKGKMSLAGLTGMLNAVKSPEDGLLDSEKPLSFSVVICTHNGASRMDACLRAVCALDYPDFEVIVVDDGSEDDLASVVAKYPEVLLLRVEHRGLSGARNVGAEEARGEIVAYTDDDCEPDAGWLRWLADAFCRYEWDACGGPNLPPVPTGNADDGDWVDEVVVACAPGAPSHILLGDMEAEHLPGCNLVVRKRAWEQVRGFNEEYWVAGDDVDFCWRMHEAGLRMGFCGAAFVWHRRRTSLWRYFKQQYGYGKAEALLMRDHPEKFVRGGGARWSGRVYSGGAMTGDDGAVIYHGWMGTAPYQQVYGWVQPTRALPVGFDTQRVRLRLEVARWVQPKVRRFARWWYSLRWRGKVKRERVEREIALVDRIERRNDYESRWWSEGNEVFREDVLRALEVAGWEGLANDSDWDMVRESLRLLVASEIYPHGNVILVRIEMGEKSGGVMPGDFVAVLEDLGLVRD